LCLWIYRLAAEPPALMTIDKMVVISLDAIGLEQEAQIRPVRTGAFFSLLTEVFPFGAIAPPVLAEGGNTARQFVRRRTLAHCLPNRLG